jgi:hypothetical protein
MMGHPTLSVVGQAASECMGDGCARVAAVWTGDGWDVLGSEKRFLLKHQLL